MKNALNLLMLGAALSLTGVGCHGTRPQNAKAIPGTRQPVADTSPFGGGRRFNNPPPVFDTPTHDIKPIDPSGWPVDPTMPLKAQTIYFEFDKASVKSSEHTKLDAVANYLKGHGEVHVRVEGNCDERGTEEYNRSLGERRALAAREYLVQLGIPADHIETISYGEDKPAETGHDEAAWSKNRRDDFEVLLPPKP